MSGRQVTVPAEALAVVLALFPDPVRSDRLGDYRPEVAEAVQALRAALAHPQPSPSAGEVLELLAVYREADDELIEANNNWPDSANEMRRRERDFERAESAIRSLDPAHLRALAAPQPTPEREALAVGTAVLYTGPRTDISHTATYTVIASSHAHLTRITNGRMETSVPHACVIPAPADAGGEA